MTDDALWVLLSPRAAAAVCAAAAVFVAWQIVRHVERQLDAIAIGGQQ